MTDDLVYQMRRAISTHSMITLLDQGADEIERLRAENERRAARVRELEADRDALLNAAGSVVGNVTDAAYESIVALEAERDALRALLAEARYHVSGVRVGGEWLTNRIEAALREGE